MKCKSESSMCVWCCNNVYNLIIIWNVNTKSGQNLFIFFTVYNLIIIWNVNTVSKYGVSGATASL